FSRYHNSKILSDITIRYGEKSEKVFYGHKQLLSSRSYWFEKAFTSSFQESEAKEITLHDDDPNALEAMFYHIYHETTAWDEDEGQEEDTSSSLQHLLQVCRVADKYDCPEVLEFASTKVLRCLRLYLSKSARVQAPEKELQDIIQSFYDSSDIAMKNSTITTNMVYIIMNHADVGILNKPGSLRPVILEAAMAIPEFGRDILFYLTD
ncbi:hypothetical protein K504DRAFT_346949, partial [Pleomassaria siparia CBS 279.74]